MTEIEFRASDAAEVVDVSYPKRTATVVVTPYDTPTVIHTGYDTFTEIVTRGAYDGVQRRAGSIRANRDHDWSRLAGRVVELYPDRPEGLVAEVRMFKTPIGQETLDLCVEEGLSVSAGFGLMREHGATGPVKAGAETWNRSSKTRTLNELWLDHVAFVPNPAYQDARVLAVRHTQETAGPDPGQDPTPNLDRLRYDEYAALAAALDAKYCSVR